jgi:ribosomal-protein-alanine N-acetyltransferase
MSLFVRITPQNLLAHLTDILNIERVSFPSPWGRESFEHEVGNPLSRFWGILSDNGLVAYICFWVAAGEIHLMNIAVHPEMRKRGLGRALMDKLGQTGVEEDVRKIWLEVRPSNKAARALYSGMGFAEVGWRRRYYTDTGEDAIVMALTLSPSEVVTGRVRLGRGSREAPEPSSGRP